MSALRKAISVGEYPAKCFQGSEPDKDHCRFLRTLANGCVIRLLDAEGNPFDLESVRNGTAHFDRWFVTEHDVQVIELKIEEETVRVNANVQEKLLQQEEQERQEREEAERRKWQRAELKAAGLWDHPQYKTLKSAYADGWHKRKKNEDGGEEITFRGRTLVRNTKRIRYVYKITLNKVYGLTPSMIDELGEPDEYCDNPHWSSGPSANLYLIERVERWIEENQERVAKARASRVNRSAAMTAVQAKKRTERWEKAQEWVNGLTISVNRPLPPTLLADARKSYTIPDGVDLLSTKALYAHARHRETNYEELLQELYQQEFCNDLYSLLRKRIDPAVNEAVVEWHARMASETCPTTDLTE